MENEEKIMTGDEYISQLDQLKANSIPKDEYERVLADNRQLAQALATRPAVSTDTDDTVVPSLEEASKNLKKLEANAYNLDFIKAALEFREAMIANGCGDPFLPHNKEYVENDYDKATAERIADGLQQMVDYSHGNKDLFNSELKRCCK